MFDFQNKDRGIYLRVTEREKEYIDKSAKEANLSVSNFMRKAIQYYVIHAVKEEEEKPY